MDCVVLEYSLAPVDRVVLKAEMHKDNRQPELLCHVPDLCGYKELLELSRRVWPVLEEAGRLSGGTNSTEAVGHIERVVSLGRELRGLLIPDTLITSLGQPDSPHHIMFRCDPMLNGVPFDFIFFWDDFICFQRPVGKQLLAGQQRFAAAPMPQRERYEAFALIDPDGQFREAMQAGDLERFQQALDKFRNDWESELAGKFEFTERAFRPVKKGYLAEAMRKNDFMLLACHHIYNKENPGLSGYVLRKAAVDETFGAFSAVDLLESITEGDRPPQVLLSVSCESGVTQGWEAEWPKNSGLYGMVDAVLRIGVPHFIGTSVKIPASSSLQIASPFFAEIASGQTAGESLRRARLAFRRNASDACDPGTALGLAFTLYGNPVSAYFCAQGHCTAGQVDQPPIGCGFVADGSPCGAVVCQKDAGYGQRLCSLHFKDEEPKCSAGHTVHSLDELHSCSIEGCTNVLCSSCGGAATGLCWFHACQQGHKIASDNQRKTCADPAQIHPGERRAVCPLDFGWMRGLCDECLAAASGAIDEEKTCPHCGRYVNDANPLSGACFDCGRQICSGCGPWHKETMYCPDSTMDSSIRNANWAKTLDQRALEDKDIASSSHLRQLLSLVDQFQTSVLTNVKERTGPLRLMPRLSLSLGEVIGLQGRVLRVEPSKAELGGQLSAALQDDWGVPNDLGLQTAWQPPENWLDDVHQVNRVCLNLIRSIWGRPTIVAVSSVVPLEFQSNRGPVVVRADTRSIRRIQQAIREWWQSQSSSNLPDIYLVVHSPLGWMPKCEPGYEPGSLTVLVAPSGGDWAVQVPPMAGMPVYVRSFVELLRPETLYKRREEMREWLERHFDLWDSVTVFKAKRSMEEELGKVFSESEVLEVFKMLAEDGLYVLATLNDKPALRRATAGERTRTLLSRRLVEIGAFFIGVLGSSIIWMFHSKLEPRLSGHWIVWLIITLVCVTLCEVLGRFAVKFRKRRG